MTSIAHTTKLQLYKTQQYVLQLAAHLTTAGPKKHTASNNYKSSPTSKKKKSHTKKHMKCIYTSTVTTYLSTRKINRLIQASTPSVNTSEATLTKVQHYTLAQLRTNKSPFLLS